MNIDSIQNGVVIDHITAGCGMRLYSLLGLDEADCSVALIRNVSSKKMGRKDRAIGFAVFLDMLERLTEEEDSRA